MGSSGYNGQKHNMPALVTPGLVLAVVLSACMTIAGHTRRPRRRLLVYIFKPLTTLLILGVASGLAMPVRFTTDVYAGAIALGLVFSLAGDIWLMLPGDRFVPGLASFLLALLCYAWAFRQGASEPDFILVLALLVIIEVITLRYLWPGVAAGLRGAFLAYATGLIGMCSLAIGRAMRAPTAGSLAAAAGAILFMAPDTMLVIDRFRRPFRLVHAAVLGTYFAGQLLISLSV